MSFDIDDPDHKHELEADNDQIIARLDAIIFLLETIANLEHGNTLNMMDGD